MRGAILLEDEKAFRRSQTYNVYTMGLMHWRIDTDDLFKCDREVSVYMDLRELWMEAWRLELI